MLSNQVRCVECSWPIPNTEENLKICPAEKHLCQKDGCTKTDGDILAIRECSWFKKAEKPKFPNIELSNANLVQCQRCSRLHKISYLRARPTHHENWQRTCDGSTCQYEDTVAWRDCPLHTPGEPKDNTNLGW